MTSDIIVEPRATLFEVEDPAAPAVGKWYWLTHTVREHDGWKPKKNEDDDDVPIYKTSTEKVFVCVVYLGSNFAKLRGLGHKQWSSWRIHFDDFHARCEWIPNPQEIIASTTKMHSDRVLALMEEVREVCALIGVTPGLALPGAPAAAEGPALGIVLSKGKPAEPYKAALVKAQKETLPALYEKIKETHAEMSRWMSAPLVPLKAQSDAMKPAVEAIEDRLFSVELYAGLCEEVVQIRKGEPAPLQEKVRIFQRRAYMDEECLAAYETGGMDFKNLEAFDRWLCKPAQLARLMPFPRCVLSFRIRRHKKYRENDGSLAAYFRIAAEEQLDLLTFLYIRNGQRMYRLNTTIDFDEQLFPDMRREENNGKLYVRERDTWIDRETDAGSGPPAWIVVGENELTAIQREVAERNAAYKKKLRETPKKERWRVYDSDLSHHVKAASSFEPFDPTNVYYDDIARFVADEAKRHNRLVYVLQGILDRSEAFHPHPPWSLWRQDSFEAAVELIYDDDRALTPGDAPDFEAYRAAGLAKLKVGDITLGQHRLWAAVEAEKYNEKHRYNEHPKKTYYYPRDNPGPGEFAHVVAIRANRCVFQWNKSRRARFGENNGEVGVKFSASTEKLFNVSAYRPGDFKQFFADPRTRANYLKWTPLLLEAEEFHTGNRTAAPVKPLAPKKTREPGGSFEYRERKRRLSWLGKAVRLKQDVTMKHGGYVNKKGSLWRVVQVCRGGGYYIWRIDASGKRLHFDSTAAKGTDAINKLATFYFEEAPEVPPDPK